ncbi:hypothetical protein [Pediococcus stilesii]|uniref:Uncharacterized protein n=1 Tax=Pediococcus stilesii TaxID=331679 RepID=A0A0R2L0Q2_9LACO|nr:hypothetical protein [Pediococcus stilesii]KRN95121.1 hypothetical protein IV81_GL000003 [Pediococcus stilesii]
MVNTIGSNEFVTKFRQKVAEIINASDISENNAHLLTINSKHFNFYKVTYPEPGFSYLANFYFSEKIEEQNDHYIELNVDESISNDLNLPMSLNPLKTLNYFFAKKYITVDILSENIIPDSITVASSPENYAFTWIKKEYTSINSKLSSEQFELIKFNTNLLNRSKFEFEDIVEKVADEQFTNYLEQCIGAYNKGWFYAASCSIAPLIETLLYKMATNYEDKPFKDKALTHGDYTEKLKHFNKKTKDYPENQRIHFDHFEEISLIRNYLTRNAVSHYSTGFANEELVNSLFMSLKDVYDRYYLPSYNFKQAHLESN